MFREGNNKFVLIGLAAIILILLWKFPGPSGSEKDTISASSTATIKSMPDSAEIYVKIETLNMDAQMSQEENSRISDEVIEQLSLEGVEEKDVETSQYYLDRKIRYGREGEQIIEGYVTVHVLKITTAETTDVGRIIDASTRGGANGINNIVFTLSDARKAELRSQAIANASQEAKAKAQGIAEGLGVKLGKLHTAQESSYDFTPYYATMAAEKATSGPTQILPQAVEVRATIAVVYSIN